MNLTAQEMVLIQELRKLQISPRAMVQYAHRGCLDLSEGNNASGAGWWFAKTADKLQKVDIKIQCAEQEVSNG